MATRGDAPDLTSRSAVTYALLDDTWSWRERLVETFEFRSTHHVRVRSSYQVRLDPQIVQPFTASTPNAARLLLPITTRPKLPLVGFDMEVDDRRAYLPLRRELAGVQSGYLLHLLSASSCRAELVGRIPPALLEAICAFTPGVFEAFGGGRARAVPFLQTTRYLRSGLGIDVTRGHVRAWERRLQPAAEILAGQLDERPDPSSSSEHVLLALPLLGPLPSSTEEIGRMVDDYVGAIRLARDEEEYPFLVTLAEYGRRWELMVDATVPVGTPTMVKVHEDRPLRLKRRGRCTQRLWTGDAASHHTVWRVLDPAVRFVGKPRGRDVRGRLALGSWEGRRVTDDALALYTSDEVRDDFVDVTMRVRPTTAVFAPMVVTQLLAAAAIVAAFKVRLGEDRVGPLALLVVPTSFIVALLLVREQTSLAARLQRWPRLCLLGELCLLWAIAIHRLLNG